MLFAAWNMSKIYLNIQKYTKIICSIKGEAYCYQNWEFLNESKYSYYQSIKKI